MPTIDFKGKSLVTTLHLTVPYRQLIPDPAISTTERSSLRDNLIIHGDNLLALKALLPSFAGRVACVYIDPPYNTGHENWRYNDNVNSPMHQEWLRRIVDRDDLTRHDKWLCLMMPRLRLLRELLREDGILFVSIDDHEVHRLRMLMDEIFGADRFVATIIWEKVYSPRMDAAGFSVSHDYILAYSKSADVRLNRLRFDQNVRQFNLRDQATGQPYRRRSLRKEGKDSRREDMPSLFFALEAPDGTPVFPIKPDGTPGRWRWANETYLREQAAGHVEWTHGNGIWEAYVKQYYDPDASRPPVTLWLHDEVGHNHAAQEEIAVLLGPRAFDTPKPTRLIKRLLEIATRPNEQAIVLDSFAGSGTTAHAVLALNAEDRGNRQFILIEQEDYADTITAERVRRVITGVPGAKDQALRQGYGSAFSFFRLGPPLDEAALLSGEQMPTYAELARYVFFTTTGDQIDEPVIDQQRCYLGTTQQYDVYLIYRPDVEYLKHAPLTHEWADALGPPTGKQRLVIAPYTILDDDMLRQRQIIFCQLPFDIYRFRG